MPKCIDKILEQYPDLDAATLRKIVEEAETVHKTPQIRLAEKTERMKELRAAGKMSAYKELKNQVEDLRKGISAVERTKDTRFKDIEDSLLSLLESKEANVMSVDELSNSMADEMSGLMTQGLRAVGVEDAAFSGRYDKQIYDLMMQGHEAEATGADADIINAIANVYRKMNDRSRHMLNRAGHTVAFNNKYVHKVHHNGSTISETNFDEWATDFMRTFDIEDAFGVTKQADGKYLPDDINDVIKQLNDLYTNINKNYSIVEGFDIGEALDSVLSRNGVVDRLNRKRTFRPQNADEFYNYNQKYGTQKNLVGTIMGQHRREAKTSAMVTVLGSNPQKNLETVIEQGLKDSKLSDGQKKGVAEKVMRAFHNVDQRGMYGHDSKSARANQTARNFIMVSKLGRASISAFADLIPTIFHSTSVTGKNPVGTAMRSMKEFMISTPKANRVEVANEMLLSSESFQRELRDRLYGGQYEAGRGSRMVDNFFRYTGLEWITDVSKTANARMALDDLGSILDNNKTGKLNTQNTNFINRFGFSPEELTVLDNIRHTRDITPRNIREADKSFFEGVKKDDLFRKVHVMVGQRTRQGVPTPDAQTRRLLGLYNPADTAKGQAFRYFAQFKSTILKVTTDIDHIARANSPDGNLNNKGTAKAFAQYMTFATGVGMFIDYLQSGLATGFEDDYDLEDPVNWSRGFAKGGALGIVGDSMMPLLAGRSSRTTKAMIFGNAVGPAANIGIETMTHLFQKDGDKLKDDVLNMMPYQNAWWGQYLFNTLREELE